ncbi:hypothetical protein [Oxobacter pfennigii]|nr:hypothetical protein [Oxobacter pfennigii]
MRYLSAEMMNNPGNISNPYSLTPPATPHLTGIYIVSPMETLFSIYPTYSPIASEITFYGAITGPQGLPR